MPATHDDHLHDRGLAFDLTLLDRRRAMKVLAGIGLVALGACGNDDEAASGTSTSSSTSPSGAAAPSTTAADDASCETIPAETAGPFPGDGSNGPDVLRQSGVVRRDITSSFGSSTTRATGVPLTINLVILDRSAGCTALAGAAVYVWHCDQIGRYSLYSPGATGENYLRGVQEADASGRVSFTSVFPACYSGRWPHVHFEVYPSLAAATGGSGRLATSQLALTKQACDAVYATSGYEQSVRNLTQVSLARDLVFADGYDHQLATMSGSAGAGYTAELSVPV